jgi:dihydrofolate synthase/folylpolyglutamate synthase
MSWKKLSLALRGIHQRDNAACVLGAVGILREKGFDVKEEAVRSGLAAVRWEGRLEIVGRCPVVLLDGAHNVAGATALKKALGEFTYRRLVLVLGILADKDYRGMVRRLSPMAHHIVVTRPPEGRALDPDVIAVEARRWIRRVDVVDNPLEAVQRATALAGEDGLVCVAGSLYLVGAVRPHFMPPTDSVVTCGAPGCG